MPSIKFAIAALIVPAFMLSLPASATPTDSFCYWATDRGSMTDLSGLCKNKSAEQVTQIAEGNPSESSPIILSGTRSVINNRYIKVDRIELGDVLLDSQRVTQNTFQLSVWMPDDRNRVELDYLYQCRGNSVARLMGAHIKEGESVLIRDYNLRSRTDKAIYDLRLRGTREQSLKSALAVICGS